MKRVIDLTGADGPFLLACVKERLACLAVCHTKTHADLLEQFCVHQLFRDMQDPDDPKYSSQLVAAINGHFEKVTKKEEDKGGALKDVGANTDTKGKSTDTKKLGEENKRQVRQRRQWREKEEEGQEGSQTDI